jgi:hypothetical protein
MNHEFDQLLKEGEIHSALELRLQDLEVKAGSYCGEVEAAKISSAVLVVTGFVLATPVAAVFAGCGVIAYAYSVAADFHQTHQFALFPLIRKSLGDLLSGVGLAATGYSQAETDDIDQAASYLSPREATEYRLLATHPERVSKWLLDQPAQTRSLSYKSLIRNLGRHPALSLSHSPAPSEISPAPEPIAPPAPSEISPAPEPIAPPAPSEISPAPEPIAPLVLSNRRSEFDWGRLDREYDNFAHLFVFGKTGAGKSYLCDRLVRFLTGFALVIGPKRSPGMFSGVQMIGVPYDYRSIYEAMTALEKLMVDRESEIQSTGKADFIPINVVLDDFPSAVAGCKDLDKTMDLKAPLKALLRNSRSSKIRLILIGQGDEVRTLGIEGEGSLRRNIEYIYLKGFAEAEAQKRHLNLLGTDRPCIIDGQVADMSFLKAYEDISTTGVVFPGRPLLNPVERLNQIFKAPSAEVEEDAIEQVSSLDSIRSAFPSWKPKSQNVAAKVVDWITFRADKTHSPSEIKKSIRLLKDDTTLNGDRLKALLDLLTQKQFLSIDEIWTLRHCSNFR